MKESSAPGFNYWSQLGKAEECVALILSFKDFLKALSQTVLETGTKHLTLKCVTDESFAQNWISGTVTLSCFSLSASWWCVTKSQGNQLSQVECNLKPGWLWILYSARCISCALFGSTHAKHLFERHPESHHLHLGNFSSQSQNNDKWLATWTETHWACGKSRLSISKFTFASIETVQAGKNGEDIGWCLPLMAELCWESKAHNVNLS